VPEAVTVPNVESSMEGVDSEDGFRRRCWVWVFGFRYVHEVGPTYWTSVLDYVVVQRPRSFTFWSLISVCWLLRFDGRNYTRNEN
jgi:hypothetical protein